MHLFKLRGKKSRLRDRDGGLECMEERRENGLALEEEEEALHVVIIE